MNYLLDTCVISELVSKQPNPKVVAWIDSLDSERVYLSVITIGEITKGIEMLAESGRKETLRLKKIGVHRFRVKRLRSCRHNHKYVLKAFISICMIIRK